MMRKWHIWRTYDFRPKSDRQGVPFLKEMMENLQRLGVELEECSRSSF
jgi:hypothetical protein